MEFRINLAEYFLKHWKKEIKVVVNNSKLNNLSCNKHLKNLILW